MRSKPASVWCFAELKRYLCLMKWHFIKHKPFNFWGVRSNIWLILTISLLKWKIVCLGKMITQNSWLKYGKSAILRKQHKGKFFVFDQIGVKKNFFTIFSFLTVNLFGNYKLGIQEHLWSTVDATICVLRNFFEKNSWKRCIL